MSLIAVFLAIGTAPAAAQSSLPPMAQDETGEGARGRLVFEDEPLPGVTIVATQDGQEVGSAVSDDDGRWRIGLPGPGVYDITLVIETLPEGIGLTDPDAVTRQLQITPGAQRTALFPLGERADVGGVMLQRFAQSLYNGIKFGLIVAIASIGLSLVYGTTRLVNFAHGDMLTFGAFAAFWMNVAGPFRTASPGLHLGLSAVIGIAMGGLLGAGMERGLWRPLRARKTGLLQLLVISIGLSLLIRYLLLTFHGGGPRSYAQYAVMSPIRIGPITTNARDLVVMGLSTLTLVGIGLMIQRTRLGKAMRAVSDNVDLAETSGIDVKRVILAVWIMAGALAAMGGIFLGAVENIQWLMGFRILLLIFAAVILGGIGTAFGAMVGGLIVGIVTEMSVLWASPELKLAWGLIALVVVLLVRPQGIFGQRERIG